MQTLQLFQVFRLGKEVFKYGQLKGVFIVRFIGQPWNVGSFVVYQWELFRISFCISLISLENKMSGFINPCPADLGYALSLQTV